MVMELAEKRERLLNRASGEDDDFRYERLQKALEGDNEYLERLARAALGAIHGPAASGPEKDLKPEAGFVKRLAEFAMEIGATPPTQKPGANIESLLTDLKSDDKMLRSRTITVLGGMGEPAVEPLISALKGGDPSIRAGVTMALGIIGEPAVEPLVLALQTDDWDVRRRAAKALGWIGDERAIDQLKGLLLDKSPYVGLEVADALSIIGGPEARTAAARHIERLA